jgi:hypothetical protein
VKRSSRYSRWSAKEKRQRRRVRLWWRWRREYERQCAAAAQADWASGGWTEWPHGDPEDDFFDRVLF